MNVPGIRIQLTFWYSLILALSLGAFGCVTYLAMIYSIRETVRSELGERAVGVRDIIIEDGPEGRPALADEVKEFADGLGPGGRIRVADAKGVIFRSAGMDAPIQPRQPGAARPWRIWIGGAPFVVQRQGMQIGDQPYDVTIAISTGSMDRALERATLLLFFTAPVFLALATLGGYWMSRRALAPVDRMTQEARNISAEDLAKRLEVPGTHDELARLSQTLNEMLSRLEAAFQKITQFTADASHELRTPVSVMRASAEIALRKPRSPAEYQETLAQVLREADHISNTIENLLALARADSGAAEMPMERVDLSVILNDACEKSKLLAEKKGVELDRSDSGRPVWVKANTDSIERLFLILLDNAVKYTAGGGSIDVRLSADDGAASVEIRDSGIGIAPEDMPHIFDRFFRADPARSRESGGAGLGLAIGRWIVEAHGGEIRVQSEPSKGSLLQVRLPICQA